MTFGIINDNDKSVYFRRDCFCVIHGKKIGNSDVCFSCNGDGYIESQSSQWEISLPLGTLCNLMEGLGITLDSQGSLDPSYVLTMLSAVKQERVVESPNLQVVTDSKSKFYEGRMTLDYIEDRYEEIRGICEEAKRRGKKVYWA